MEKWNASKIPDLSGKTAIVTGANTGIGFEIALQLYIAGANVILACRDLQKARIAAANMLTSEGRGTVQTGQLDLADLQSVKEFVQWFRNSYSTLDILVNNAGVMYPPAMLSDTGFEWQFAINFLGHFALTAGLFPILQPHTGRVITMCSGAYKRVKTIDFDNLRLEKEYDPTAAYATSKLADLMFALELSRRCGQNGISIVSIGAHPGVTRTDLQRYIDPLEIEQRLAIFGQLMSPAQAALPALYAATAADAVSGEYYGPDGENEYSGYPGTALITDAARDVELAKRLWELAERATGSSLL